MSDLASFVAATIRDKVVDDLMKEVDGLKMQLSKTQEIEVTGSNGTPVYATGMLDQGEYTADGKRWRVDLDAQAGVPPSAMVHSCFGRGCGSIEIRVGGSVWKSIHGMMTPESILSILLECWTEEKTSSNFIDFRASQSSSVSFLWISTGPFLSEDLDVELSVERNELRDSVDLLFLLERTDPKLCFSLNTLEFDATKIKTTLKNLGIKNMDTSVHNEDYCTCPICTNEAEECGEEFDDSDSFESDDIDSFESDDSDIFESDDSDSDRFESDNSDEFEEGEEGSAITSTICSTIPMWLEREKKKREEAKEKPRSD
jgi:hypothetical protein